MKCYMIERGTIGKVITQHPGHEPRIRDWVTTRDLMFTDTVDDPVRRHNQAQVDNLTAMKLAAKGYCVFGGECGFDGDATHLLAIPMHNVMVR